MLVLGLSRLLSNLIHPALRLQLWSLYLYVNTVQCLATGVTMFMGYEVFVVVTLLLSSGMTMCSLADKY